MGERGRGLGGTARRTDGMEKLGEGMGHWRHDALPTGRYCRAYSINSKLQVKTRFQRIACTFYREEDWGPRVRWGGE